MQKEKKNDNHLKEKKLEIYIKQIFQEKNLNHKNKIKAKISEKKITTSMKKPNEITNINNKYRSTKIQLKNTN